VRNLPDESVFSEIDYSRLGTLLQSYKSEPLQKVVTNLRPFTIYEVLVSAHTHAGEGASVLTTVETEQDKPATEPTGLRYTNLTSTSVNISWTEPEIPNGIITYYTVYISSGQIFTRTAEDKFAVVEDLEKYKQYTVSECGWSFINFAGTDWSKSWRCATAREADFIIWGFKLCKKSGKCNNEIFGRLVEEEKRYKSLRHDLLNSHHFDCFLRFFERNKIKNFSTCVEQSCKWKQMHEILFRMWAQILLPIYAWFVGKLPKYFSHCQQAGDEHLSERVPNHDLW